MKIPSILNGNQNATMSDEQAHSYVTILSSGIDEKFDIPYSNCGGFAEKVLYQKLKASGVEVSIGLFVWICIISNGVPGNIVMWVWTISNLAKNQGKKTFSLLLGMIFLKIQVSQPKHSKICSSHNESSTV